MGCASSLDDDSDISLPGTEDEQGSLDDSSSGIPDTAVGRVPVTDIVGRPDDDDGHSEARRRDGEFQSLEDHPSEFQERITEVAADCKTKE